MSNGECSQLQEEQQSVSSSTQRSSESASRSCDDAPPTSLDELGRYDIICGRHIAAYNNVGNRRFIVTVSLALGRYTCALTRLDKTAVIKSIVDTVRGVGGHFLIRRDGAWIELTASQAHDKIRHTLRDMLGDTLRSPSNTFPNIPRSSRSPSSSAKMPPSLSVLTSSKKAVRRLLDDRNTMIMQGATADSVTQPFFTATSREIPTNHLPKNVSSFQHDDMLATALQNNACLEPTPIQWPHRQSHERMEFTTTAKDSLQWPTDRPPSSNNFAAGEPMQWPREQSASASDTTASVTDDTLLLSWLAEESTKVGFENLTRD